MRILVDADACPTKDIIVSCANKNNLKCLMFFDTSHVYYDDYSKIYTVDKGPDSVDFFLVKHLLPNDIVVTNDYGVAAMALSKGASCLNNSGMIYDNQNIDFLLASKFNSINLRKQGVRTKGPKKRTSDDNKKFKKSLEFLITK